MSRRIILLDSHKIQKFGKRSRWWSYIGNVTSPRNAKIKRVLIPLVKHMYR